MAIGSDLFDALNAMTPEARRQAFERVRAAMRLAALSVDEAIAAANALQDSRSKG